MKDAAYAIGIMAGLVLIGGVVYGVYRLAAWGIPSIGNIFGAVKDGVGNVLDAATRRGPDNPSLIDQTMTDFMSGHTGQPAPNVGSGGET